MDSMGCLYPIILLDLCSDTSPAADNYDDEYDGGAGFDGAFEGFHDNHTQLQAGQPAEGPGGIPMSHSFAGVEPMGEFVLIPSLSSFLLHVVMIALRYITEEKALYFFMCAMSR